MAFIPSYWREIPQRYRYEANRCKDSSCCDDSCTGQFFPPRRTCGPWCDCELVPYTVAQTGKVLTYTIIRVGPTNFADEVPYALAVAEMEDGTRLTAQLVDVPVDEVKNGMPVKIEFRKVQKDGEAGILMYGYKLVPA